MQHSRKRKRSMGLVALSAIGLSGLGLSLIPYGAEVESRAAEKKAEVTAKDVSKYRLEAPLKKAVFGEAVPQAAVAAKAAKQLPPHEKVEAPRDRSKKRIENPLKKVLLSPRPISEPTPQATADKSDVKPAKESSLFVAKGAIERPLKAVLSTRPQEITLPPTVELAIDIRDYAKGLVERSVKAVFAPQPQPQPAPKKRDSSKGLIELPLKPLLAQPEFLSSEFVSPPDSADSETQQFAANDERASEEHNSSERRQDESKRKIELTTEAIVGKVKESLGNPAVEANVEANVDATINPQRHRQIDSQVNKDENENPKVKPGLVEWHDDFETAKMASAISGKPVLLFQMMGQLDQRFT
jgi:hypothetical protein